MTDKFKDVFENINDRVSNPLIFSFVCSWLVCNWQIPVALIWYDRTQFSDNKGQTIFDFIESYWKEEGNLLIPIFIAIIYTIGVSFLKNGIRIISAHAQKWGEDEEIKALDGGKIAVEKYIKLKKQYIERIKDIENIANDEKDYLDKNASLLLELIDEKKKLEVCVTKSIDDKKFIDDLSNIAILDGTWLCKTGNVVTSEIDKDELMFSGYEVYEVFEFNKKEKIFEIRHFSYNTKMNKIFFIKERMPNSSIIIPFERRYYINDLNFKDKNTLIGKENGYDIEYKRKI